MVKNWVSRSSATSYQCDLGQVSHFKTQFPHVRNGDNNRICFVERSWRLNKMMHKRFFNKKLAQRKHSINVNYINSNIVILLWLNFYTTNPTLSWYVDILLGVDFQLYAGLVMKCWSFLAIWIQPKMVQSYVWIVPAKPRESLFAMFSITTLKSSCFLYSSFPEEK